jgi:hypothetical protein
LGAWAVSASPLQLTLERQDAGQLRLQAGGLTSTNVNLETSFDLTEWFFVQAAGVTNGRAGFVVNRDEPLGAQFFRVVEAPPPFTGQVGPQPDLSRSVAALVTPEAGGVLSLDGPGGVVYELTVGPQQVWEPVVITLTAITNFTDLPLANSFRAAVQLEPDGLEFRSEAQLRIQFPQVVPQFEMVGYGFAADGGGFHLQPWVVRSNEVVVPVRHFSGVGVAAEPFPPSGNFSRSGSIARGTPLATRARWPIKGSAKPIAMRPASSRRGASRWKSLKTGWTCSTKPATGWNTASGSSPCWTLR